MTQEKAEYLKKKLKRKIKKEFFEVFDGMLVDVLNNKNYSFEAEYGILDNKTPDGSFYVYYGDYRLNGNEKFDGAYREIKIDNKKLRCCCNIQIIDRDDTYFDSAVVGSFVLARLMHFYKKYDRKLRKKDIK
ncbi:hypothetical protein [Campylobacter suis]|uniref:YopX protein domain-containing protein n=1 Tax=Campylobacter suis TaxID=2790657 RepID=A0ABM8Q609_9BACT|nr:hypothetical protein [Campylobacter suis]CAD7288267.1 hypothetical protein LMG8286_01235 [Campylobacter suis]